MRCRGWASLALTKKGEARWEWPLLGKGSCCRRKKLESSCFKGPKKWKFLRSLRSSLQFEGKPCVSFDEESS